MRRKFWGFSLALGCCTVLLASGCSGTKSGAAKAPALDAQSSAAQTTAADTKSLPAESGRVAVPGFDGATAWLNVDHALTMKELAGHVVVVDFWTSCCINCLQTLPTLAKIEDQFANDPVVVVGVHSPKFDAETERARLSDAVRQYSIRHPVAVDGSMKIWNAWGVDAWPTVIVLDTKGRAVWVGSGEPDREKLAGIVTSALAEGKANGSLITTKITGISPEKDDSGPLAFPGKVTSLTGGGLAVSDTGHNRIVLFDAAGKVSSVIGSGLSGNTDG
ncbi:MAG: thioredoxin-like domain-containing protein, partial [Polyangiaceae bacterium]